MQTNSEVCQITRDKIITKSPLFVKPLKEMQLRWNMVGGCLLIAAGDVESSISIWNTDVMKRESSTCPCSQASQGIDALKLHQQALHTWQTVITRALNLMALTTVNTSSNHQNSMFTIAIVLTFLGVSAKNAGQLGPMIFICNGGVTNDIWLFGWVLLCSSTKQLIQCQRYIWKCKPRKEEPVGRRVNCWCVGMNMNGLFF